MFEHIQLPNFEQEVLPHLDAAYNCGDCPLSIASKTECNPTAQLAV